MHSVVDSWLKVERTPEEDVKRLADLEAVLKDYGFKGDYLFILKAYEDHKRSSVYPYAGGRGEQPQWILDDFDTLALLEEREFLRKKIGTKPPAPTMPGGMPPAAPAAPLPLFKDLKNRKAQPPV